MAASRDIDNTGDLSALAWVHEELRRALEAAHKSLRRYLKEAGTLGDNDVDTVDPSVLRQARTQIHQGAGALELVGLPTAARMLRASEAAVTRIAAKPKLVTPAAVETIERGSFALLDYLSRLLAGKQLSPLAMFPQYKAMQELAGAQRVHPADLWAHDWQWRPVADVAGTPALATDAGSIAGIESEMLIIMRGLDALAPVRMSMRFAALANGVAGPSAERTATLWRLASAFYESQAGGLLKTDVYTKRMGSRLLAQLRGGANADPSDRLAEDLLFFCTQAATSERRPAGPRLLAVRQAWGLGTVVPVDYEKAHLGRFDPALIVQARKRLAGAKDVWSAVAGGELARIGNLNETFALVGESLTKLYPQGDRLAQALQSAASQTVAAQAAPSAELAMEVATGLLYLDASFEDADLDHPEAAERVSRLAQRVDDVRQGRTPEPLEAWMEDLYRRVSDRQTMGSVVQELRASLSEVEKQIDTYFRDPSHRDVLIPVPAQLSSMRGVLSVLGLDQASQAVVRMRDDVDALAQTEVDPQQAIAAGTFDRLADNLGALSFLIDMLSVQPAMAKSLFHFEPETGLLRAVMGLAHRPSGFGSLETMPMDMTPELTARAQAVAEAAADPGADLPSLSLDLVDLHREAQASDHAPLVELAERSLQTLQNAQVQPQADAPSSIFGVDELPDLDLSAPGELVDLPTPEQAAERAVEAARAEVAADLRDFLASQPAAFEAAVSRPQHLGAVSRPAPLATVTPPAPPAATGLEDDDEMREIFLEEAREVIENARASLATLRDEPDDHGAMTAVRRAFHTLKGSSRMVGLKAFGEAGWACEQLFNARLAEAAPASADLLGFSTEALDHFERWVDAISQRADAGWAHEAISVPADALRQQHRRLPVGATAAPEGAVEAAPALAEPLTATLAEPELDAAAPPPVMDLDFTLDLSAGEAAAGAPLIEPLIEPLSAAEPPPPAPQAAWDSDSLLNLPLDLADVAPTDHALAALPTLEGEPQPDLDVPLDAPEVVDVAQSLEALQSPEVLDLPDLVPETTSDSAFDGMGEPVEPVAEVAPAAPPEPHPEALVEPESDLTEAEEEPVKVIGPLRISIPLFNIYLNEADELSRRLVTELAEWSHELRRPVGESAVALAHSLAGSSATVGYTDLSQLARSLEHALMRSHDWGTGTADEAQLFSEAGEEIRRLLHQFAAGFLKSPEPSLLERLSALEHHHAERLAQRAAQPAPDSGAAPADFVPSALAGGTQFADFGQAELKSFADLPEATVRATPVHDDVLVDVDDDIDAIDAIDEQLFPIFEEEGLELMPQLQQRLREWVRRPSEAAAASACMRTLHTLKGGARLAGAMRLGEMAHRLESGIEHLVARGHVQVGEVEGLLGRVDAIEAAFEALRRGESTTPELPQPSVYEATPSMLASVSLLAPLAPLPALPVEPANDAVAEPTPMPSADEATTSHTMADASHAAEPDGPIEAPVAAPVAAPMAAPRAIDWSRFARDTVAPAIAEAQRPAAYAQAAVRVRAPLLDRLVSHAGEVSITRSRIESDVTQLKGSLGDLTDNLERLRRQLRDIELQAETQISTRMEAAKAASQEFDPLEMDRFTRFQELTRMMAESVNDVATVHRNLQRTLQSAEDELAAQARLTRDLQDDLLRTRMVEFDGLSERLYRVVRQAAKEAGKQVRLDIAGGSIDIDRGVLDRMTGAFEHLLRNCVAHGIESPAQRTAAGKDATGQITVVVTQEGNEVGVEFRDDGAGLDLAGIRAKAQAVGLVTPEAELTDAETANLIFTPGFSTADTVTELAGRGIGMDVVRTDVNAMGGRIETATARGQGTSFRLVLPLTTAVTQVVMLRCGEATVAVPSPLVEIVRRVSPADVEQGYASGSLPVDGRPMPFFWLGALLHGSPRGQVLATMRTVPVVIIRSAAQRIALHVDEVMGNQEVVVKNLGPQLSRLPGLAGMTLLPSGSPALIYNPVALATLYGDAAWALMRQQPTAEQLMPAEPEAPQAPLVLVVDDSLTVRRVTQRLLLREGYRVALAKDGLEGLEKLAEERPVVLLSDIEMPRMDGFDLVRNLRADAKLADLPVIMITSRIAQKHRDYAAELGVDHYLGKPYSEEDLLALVARYARSAVLA